MLILDFKTVVIGLLIGLIIFVAGFGGLMILYPKIIAYNQAETTANTETAEKNEKAEKSEKIKKDSEKKEVEKDDETDEEKISNKSSKKHSISEQERKERIIELTSGMTVETDDMENTTTYLYPSDVNMREAEEGIKFAAMIVEDNNIDKSRLSFGAIYEGDDWIFFEKIYFKADNERFSINTPHLAAKNEVFMGGVREIHEIKNNKKNRDYLRKIANARNVKMRFSGDGHSRERDMTPTEIEHIRNILELYDLMQN